MSQKSTTFSEEVNAAIELHVMGNAEVWQDDAGAWWARRTAESEPVPVRTFTTDPSAAQLAVSRLAPNITFNIVGGGGMWRVTPQRARTTRRGRVRQDAMQTIEDNSREMAIAIAVLFAIGHPLGQE